MWRVFIRMYNYKILLPVGLILLTLTQLPEGNLEDWFHLKQVIVSGAYGRILTSFISAFSFLVTVLVLSYGFLRERFRRLALRELLDNRFSHSLISFFISVFLTNIFTIIYLERTPIDHSSLNVAYFSLFFSVGYFVVFLPLALVSIASADSHYLIDKYVDRLALSEFPQIHTHEATITMYEDNPLTVLAQLSRAYAEKDDYHSVNVIIFLTQQRIENLIGESKDRGAIGRYLSGQRIIWDAIAQKCFQKKEFSVFESIFVSVQAFHFHFSKNKIPLLFLEELRFFVVSLIEKMTSEGLNEHVEKAILLHEKILEYHYDNSTPKEEELPDLIHFFEQTKESYENAYKNKRYNPNDFTNAQWTQIYSDIPNFFTIIAYKSIEKKNFVLFGRVISSLNALLGSVYRSSLSDRQKAWLCRDIAGDLCYLQTLALKKGVALERLDYIDSDLVVKAIDQNSICKEYLLMSASDFFVDLFNNDKIDHRSINFFGSVGRHCANQYLQNASCEVSFEYILRVVKKIKSLLEENLEKWGQAYRWLQEAVSSYLIFHKDAGYSRLIETNAEHKTSEELIERLEVLLASFQANDFKDEDNRIYWDPAGPRPIYKPEKG